MLNELFPPHGPGDPTLAGEPLIDAEVDAAPVPTAAAASSTRAGRLLLGASLVLIAFNLRSIFASLAALLPEVMRGTGATPAVASLMTTLPVLCLGLFSPIAPKWAGRIGSERVILVCLCVLAAGTALRGVATVPALLLAGLLAGSSIAVVNVLLPGLVKRDFPERIAAMTGLYSMALCGGAAAAAGRNVPNQHGRGGSWGGALAAWAVPAAIVAALWAPQALRAPLPRKAARHNSGGTLWRDGLAWQVSLFMGLQSALAYCVFGWLAPILRARGLEAAEAGFVVTVSVVGQMAACLIAPSLAVAGRDQRAICVVLFSLVTVSFLGCYYAPLRTVWGWAALLGIGQGGAVAVALTLILLRAPNATVAAHLSGMAQGLGYTLAAAGPLLVGILRQWAGDFRAVPLLFVVLGFAGMLAGLGAGRAKLVRE